MQQLWANSANLALSVNTVKYHVQETLLQLHVRNQAGHAVVAGMFRQLGAEDEAIHAIRCVTLHRNYRTWQRPDSRF